MANEYDFRQIEKNATNLETEYTSFEDKVKKVTSSAKTLRFDDRKYGRNAVNRRVNSIIDNGTRELNNSANSSLNTINRYAHNSTEAVKSEARAINHYIAKLNSILETVPKINEYFSKKQYSSVICAVDAILYDVDNAKLSNYLYLLKLKSYDAICESALINFDSSAEKYFESYVQTAKACYAKVHLPLALSKSVIYYAKLVKLHLLSDKELAYSYSKKGLAVYTEMSNAEQQKHTDAYQYLYQGLVDLYNELSAYPYDKFDYNGVLKYMKDACLLSRADIKNEFYKAQDTSVISRFKYVTMQYKKADEHNIRLAMQDTVSLLKTEYNIHYYTFWFSNIEQFTWSIVGSIFVLQEQLMSIGEVLNSAEVVHNAITKTALHESKLNEVAIYTTDYYYNFCVRNQKAIPLLSFLRCVLALERIYSLIKKSALSDTEKDSLEAAYCNFASTVFGTIKTNIKYCSGVDADMQNKLNELYLKAADILNVKTPKKDLLNRTKSKPLTNDFTVKLSSYETLQNKKKAWIIGGCIAGIAIAVVVSIIIIISL